MSGGGPLLGGEEGVMDPSGTWWRTCGPLSGWKMAKKMDLIMVRGAGASRGYARGRSRREGRPRAEDLG